MENTQNSRVAEALKAMIDLDELQLKFIFPSGLGNTLAIVEIHMSPVIFKGFRVMKSDYKNRKNEYVNVLPPCLPKGSGDTYKLFFIEDKDLWFKLEDKILEKYYEKRSTSYESQY